LPWRGRKETTYKHHKNRIKRNRVTFRFLTERRLRLVRQGSSVAMARKGKGSCQEEEKGEERYLPWQIGKNPANRPTAKRPERGSDYHATGPLQFR